MSETIRYNGIALMDHKDYDNLRKKLNIIHKEGEFSDLLFTIQQENIYAELKKWKTKVCYFCEDKEITELTVLTYSDPMSEHDGEVRYKQYPERCFRKMDLHVDLKNLESKVKERFARDIINIKNDEMHERFKSFTQLLDCCEKYESLEDDFTIELCPEHNGQKYLNKAIDGYIELFRAWNGYLIAKNEIDYSLSKTIISRLRPEEKEWNQ